MLHLGEAAQQTSGALIARLLHSNGLVNSPMRLIATFKRGRGGWSERATGAPAARCH